MIQSQNFCEVKTFLESVSKDEAATKPHVIAKKSQGYPGRTVGNCRLLPRYTAEWSAVI